MTPEDRSRIKQRIQTMITELRDTIESLEQDARPVSLDQPIGRLSRMDSMANQAISGRVLAESRVRLRKLEWALAHVEDEDFGICAGCGEDIPVARLLAVS
ncbi:MAG: TraR/DksA family transcriptional regulator, partial [Desulfohalobiaceae bacterium]